MKGDSSKNKIKELLSLAGISVDGSLPWDIQVRNERFYNRLIAEGSIGLGESYMDQWWDVEALDEFFYRTSRAGLDRRRDLSLENIRLFLRSKLTNMQSKVGSQKVAKEHYDLDNELYMSFLDPFNQYTCGYFKETEDLNVAQEQKLDLICRKLMLKPEDRVLDIGCGWGGFAKFAAKNYGSKVTGITISEEQLNFARTFCKGYPISIEKLDYRDLNKEFDKVLICGMIEHVGYKNYARIFEVVKNNLSENGLFLLHTIGRNTSTSAVDPWFEKYIFPNSMLPSIKQLSKAAEGRFVIEDLHNFGYYYAKTCRAWWVNFKNSWEHLKDKYDDRFYRMWKYYLLSSAGAFEARSIQLWQILMSKNGVVEGMKPVR